MCSERKKISRDPRWLEQLLTPKIYIIKEKFQIFLFNIFFQIIIFYKLVTIIHCHIYFIIHTFLLYFNTVLYFSTENLVLPFNPLGGPWPQFENLCRKVWSYRARESPKTNAKYRDTHAYDTTSWISFLGCTHCLSSMLCVFVLWLVIRIIIRNYQCHSISETISVLNCIFLI